MASAAIERTISDRLMRARLEQLEAELRERRLGNAHVVGDPEGRRAVGIHLDLHLDPPVARARPHRV